jgi:hypothetical protein
MPASPKEVGGSMIRAIGFHAAAENRVEKIRVLVGRTGAALDVRIADVVRLAMRDVAARIGAKAR